MQTAALIVAAGMSSRMGDFKPMMNIGSISIAQRVVATFQQTGVDKIVMITGYNATILERHLSGNGIVFIRNEDYATTHMFDSVKIGLEYIEDKCDQILFTPVDIPLFTADTVRKLISSKAALAYPVCEGEIGHPTLIDCTLIAQILADSGEGGLHGALERCDVEPQYIAVEDKGILHDADTPEDYRALLNYHNQQLVRPVISVSLAKEKPFFDHQVATLLHLIDETSSVRTACQRMQISYSNGWNLIKTLESQLNYPLIVRNQGGSKGGKSVLTVAGKCLLSQYEGFAVALKEYAARIYDNYFQGIF